MQRITTYSGPVGECLICGSAEGHAIDFDRDIIEVTPDGDSGRMRPLAICDDDIKHCAALLGLPTEGQVTEWAKDIQKANRERDEAVVEATELRNELKELTDSFEVVLKAKPAVTPRPRAKR